MARYFYDTEFVESGRTRSIEPLSIGIVSEDGSREYYAQYTRGLVHALRHPWVREHVVPHLDHLESKTNPEGQTTITVCPGSSIYEGPGNGYCGLIGCPWKMDSEIAAEIQVFMNPEKYGPVELWGYYADYDHVVLSQTFGTMMDLPKGFPMYTRDLKQWVDDLGAKRGEKIKLPEQTSTEHHALSDAKWNRNSFLRLKTGKFLEDLNL